MESAPKVQLLLKDRIVQELAFDAERLRIGRMKENDLVVNNVAVSRFHCVLHREGEGFRLEDLGSENGTWVNGERIDGGCAIEPGDEILVGKHVIRIGEGRPITSGPAAAPSDAWDAAQTFLADAPLVGAAPTPEPVAPDEITGPDPAGAFAFGEEDLFADAQPEAGAEEIAVAELADDDELPSIGDPLTDPFDAGDPPSLDSAPNPEHTALFDFGVADAATPSPPEEEPEDTAARAVEAEPETHTTEWDPSGPIQGERVQDVAPADLPEYAGWIVQRGGRLDRVVAWEDDVLVVGRASDCTISLGEAGVSRRHARLERGEEGYAVADLDSVNGTWLNGERLLGPSPLRVGDVVRIEDFELTFVLDHKPVGSEVQAKAAPASAEPGNQTMFAEALPGEEVDEAAVLESDLLEEAEESPEKDLERVEVAETVAEPTGPTEATGLTEAPVRVEVEIARERLPAAVRLAMEEAGEELLRLPAEIHLRLK